MLPVGQEVWMAATVISCGVIAAQHIHGRLLARRSPPRPDLIKPQRPSPPPRPHRSLSAAKATDLFIEWLIQALEDGWLHNPFLAAGQIDKQWRGYAAENGIYPINGGLIREQMRDRGYQVGLVRLNRPEFLHIKQSIGKDRAAVYRIPSRAEYEASKLTSGQLPVNCQDARFAAGSVPTVDRQLAGNRPVAAKPRKRQLIPKADQAVGIQLTGERREAA